MALRAAGNWTVEWFGTATFRVRRPGLDLFFDGYLDRLPGLPPVGLRTAEVLHSRSPGRHLTLDYATPSPCSPSPLFA